jgi:hypothetical protein
MCPCAPDPPKTQEKQERNDKRTHEAVVINGVWGTHEIMEHGQVNSALK